MLLPLLMFGLPIVPSEMILYNMLSAQGWTNGLLTLDSMMLIFVAAIVSASIGWVACSLGVNVLVDFMYKHYRILAISAVAAAIASVVYLGMQSYNTVFYLLLLAVSIAIGLLFAKKDFNPLLVSFLIAQPLAATAKVVVQLYF